MGVTLEELLESSGMNQPDGGQEKTASQADAPSDDLDLVDALRKLADDQTAGIRQEAQRELIEKTAEIMVIKKTIEEIDKVASLGVASEEQEKLAAFLKVAIDKGHSEREIVDFLEKNAVLARVGRAIRGARMGGLRKKMSKLDAKADRIAAKDTQLLRDKLRHASPAELEKHLTVLKDHYGPDKLGKLLGQMKDEGISLPSAAYKMVPKEIKAGKTIGLKLPGGTEKQVSVEKAKQYGLPLAAGAAGLAVGGRKKDEGGGKGGVVVVKS